MDSRIESEFLLNKEDYTRWCNYDNLVEIYRLIEASGKLTEPTSFVAMHWKDTEFLVETKYERKVAFFVGDEITGVIPSYIDNVALVVREQNHHESTRGHPKILPKPLPRNRRNNHLYKGKLTDPTFHKFNGTNTIPLVDRPYDICFAGNGGVIERTEMGQVVNLLDPRYLRNSKALSTGWFATGITLEEYADRTSLSKVILCPKGGAPETFRYTEAYACGCTVITTFMPDYLWYYDKSPAVHIENWSGITNELLEHVFSTDVLEKSYVDNMAYYERCLTEEATANKILDRLA